MNYTELSGFIACIAFLLLAFSFYGCYAFEREEEIRGYKFSPKFWRWFGALTWVVIVVLGASVDVWIVLKLLGVWNGKAI